MKRKTYLILGALLVLISLILFFAWVPSSVRFSTSIWVDGLWFMILGIISGFILGVSYLLFGFNKFRINRLSNLSVKFVIVALALILVGAFLIYFFIILIGGEPMGILLIVPISFVSYFLSLVALILCIVSIFKSG